jgi:hypothetical protein
MSGKLLWILRHKSGPGGVGEQAGERRVVQLVSGADLILGLVFFFFCSFRALLLLPIYSQLLFRSLSLSCPAETTHAMAAVFGLV